MLHVKAGIFIVRVRIETPSAVIGEPRRDN